MIFVWLNVGKILIIGGGIANFTNVATTFKGIVRALQEYRMKLVEGKVIIYVRRAGPNYQEGLRVMRELGESDPRQLLLDNCSPTIAPRQ
jgi:ATP citrate (pro-S)-lyase